MVVQKQGNLRSIFARNLRKSRLNKSLSQERLAELAGLHRTYVSSVERCERNITLETVERFAAALGVDPIDLLRKTS
ncbi:MAG: helix-turn-helix transcriptional regulator [Terriglobia bacterium]